MKQLKEMFTNEGHFQSPRGHSYKPKYSPADWEDFLKHLDGHFFGDSYSLLGGVDTGVAEEKWDMSNPEDMILDCADCIKTLSKKDARTQDILWDIAQFIYSDCHWDKWEYGFDQQDIDNFKADRTSYDWGVEAGKIFYVFEGPNFGTFTKWARLLAEYGDTTQDRAY